MRQKLINTLKLNQKLVFNSSLNASLNLLQMDDEELELYIKEVKPSYRPFPRFSSIDLDLVEPTLTSEITLSDVILEQVRYSSEQYNLTLCELLISELDSNGYFRETKVELFSRLRYSNDEIEKHLSFLRTLEPYGCFAFSLSDCLSLQCLADDSDIAKSAYKLCFHLEAVATEDLEVLTTECDLDVETCLQAIAFIKSLNPKPASSYANVSRPLICEVEITKDENEVFHICSINNDWIVQSLVEDFDDTSEEMKTKRAHIDSLLNFIEKRNVTITQVTRAILDIQESFFRYGEPLKRCTLEMLKDKTGLAQSTISRAISNKSVLYNSTYYPLKYFMVSGGTSDTSPNEIHSLIKKIVDSEDTSIPLSDQQISNILLEREIQVSRRTVAKYRDILNIPNSIKRLNKEKS